jgi:2-polyprenyl-3-methyl-5-hydroxy-6-metoxy-1,4-benzoquinol methylase
MTDSQTKAYFDHKAGYGISKKRLRGILTLAGDLTGKTALDIGCGAGELGTHLKAAGAQRVVGCDIADGAVAAAQDHLDAAFIYDVRQQNLAALCAGEQFDVVVATELIEHLFQPGQLLAEVKTVLKPDGVFIITTPNLLVWTNRIKMLLGRFEYTKTGLMDESHVHFFTYSTLHQLLQEHGFAVVQEANVYNRRVPQWLAPHIKGLSTFQMVFACKVT